MDHVVQAHGHVVQLFADPFGGAVDVFELPECSVHGTTETLQRIKGLLDGLQGRIQRRSGIAEAVQRIGQLLQRGGNLIGVTAVQGIYHIFHGTVDGGQRSGQLCGGSLQILYGGLKIVNGRISDIGGCYQFFSDGLQFVQQIVQLLRQLNGVIHDVI